VKILRRHKLVIIILLLIYVAEEFSLFATQPRILSSVLLLVSKELFHQSSFYLIKILSSVQVLFKQRSFHQSRLGKCPEEIPRPAAEDSLLRLFIQYLKGPMFWDHSFDLLLDRSHSPWWRPYDFQSSSRDDKTWTSSLGSYIYAPSWFKMMITFLDWSITTALTLLFHLHLIWCVNL